MMEKDRNILFVDGYNIINYWPHLKQLMDSIGLDAAREQLIHHMAEYQILSGWEVTVIFDAHMVKGSIGHEEWMEDVHVVYTREFETADRYIERKLDLFGKHEHIRVATSDGMIQQIVLGRGGVRIPANELYLDYQALKEGSCRIERKNRTFKNKNMVTIDEKIIKKLDDLKKKLPGD